MYEFGGNVIPNREKTDYEVALGRQQIYWGEEKVSGTKPIKK